MKRFSIILIIIAYSFLAIFGAFSFHYENKDMAIMGTDCHHEVCINVFDDINNWQNLLFTFLPIIKIFFYLSFSIFLIFYFDKFRLNLINKFYLYNYVEDYYRRLFSKGLLNPKSP